ncbi:MAG: sugar transferase [Alphaproteobacteria bacterium]
MSQLTYSGSRVESLEANQQSIDARRRTRHSGDGSLQRAVKRLLDVLLAGGGLVVFGPAMFFTALLIWQTRGPALYRQERIGINGRRFRCLKFRTMVLDSQEKLAEHLASNEDAAREWKETHKLRDDPRVTKLGRFLRKSSIDELPQLINVLRGEMSIVGPRPIVQDEVEKYGEHFAAYTSVPPGITGLWQICGRSDIAYPERVRLDVMYVENWTLAGDLMIIFRTIPAVLRARGAT